MLGCYVGMTSSPATYVLSDKVQSAVVGKGIISQPSAYPSLGYDKLLPKEGKEEGLYVGQDANEGKESGDGRENGLNLTATGDQESKTDEEVEAGLYLATVKKQETFYSPLGEPDLRDLPSFAHQISQGMVCKSYCKYVLQLQLYNFFANSQFRQEYLSSLGVLHRDLACRNILVDDRKLLKISDFGLSRDTLEYVSSRKDKLPLRWMAPETVIDNVCTDKSDV